MATGGSIYRHGLMFILLDDNLSNESVVSLVSKRYMRAGIGNERLLVCLSEYLP